MEKKPKKKKKTNKKAQKKEENQELNLRQSQSQFNSYVKYSGLAFQMIAILGLGVWGGWKIDSWMQNDFPAFLIICSLLAFASAMVIIIRGLPD